MRTFETGATRDAEDGKHDFEGYLSPLVLKRFAEYMTKHRVQADGKLRASDNWQKGIPRDAYMKSGWRHFFDWWREHRGLNSREGIEDALCGLLFNVQGYLHELLKEKAQAKLEPHTPTREKLEDIFRPDDRGTGQATPLERPGFEGWTWSICHRRRPSVLMFWRCCRQRCKSGTPRCRRSR